MRAGPPLIFYFLLSVFAVTAGAQNILFPKFKVISLPQKAGYDVNRLNEELRISNSKEDVIKILRSHKELASVSIVIRIIKNSTEITWWRINPGRPEKEGDFTILQSKASESTKFNTSQEARKYFHDTIACFDTLRLGMYLQDVNFRIEDYFFKTINRGITETVPIPYDKKYNLIITSNLFLDSTIVTATLYNKADDQIPVANCTFFFLDSITKSSLADIAKNLENEIAGINTRDIANYLCSYLLANHGRANYADILRFLTMSKK